MHLNTIQWMTNAKELSKVFKKYGDFLPEQKELLKRIHGGSFNNSKQVSTFMSPTGTGKTHAICIAAKILQDTDNSIAIVTPSNYLKQEFIDAKKEVFGIMDKVEIMNLAEYTSSDKIFDYVLIDEAHNLKSFIELDNKMVKNIAIKLGTDIYEDLIDQIPPSKSFIAKQISHLNAKEFLKKMQYVSEIKTQVKEILNDATAWKTFVYVGRNYPENYIRFIKSEGQTDFKKAKKQLMLFSATNLSDNELSFYCGINKNEVLRTEPVKRVTKIDKSQREYLGLKEEISDSSKVEFVKTIIEKVKTRTLVLFANSYSCNKFYSQVKNNSRIFCIPNEFDHNREKFEKFLKKEDGILFTSSSIFWEGITIKNLKLLIIMDPPFPHPNLLDLSTGNSTNGTKIVKSRLEQGAGRIGRRKGERGVGVFLFKIPPSLESWMFKFKNDETYNEEYTWNFIAKLQSII